MGVKGGARKSRDTRVLHVVPTYFPALHWGGPIYSTKAICDGISRMPDMHVRVLTTDAAGPSRRDNLSLSRNPARFDAGYAVYYARRMFGHSVAPGLLRVLRGMVEWSDVVHLTATYSFPTIPTLLCARSLDRPVVWSPRGALQASEQWKTAPNKLPKALFERACRISLPRSTTLHVTAPIEEELSLRRIPGVRTAVIPNAVEAPGAPSDRQWRPRGAMRLVFLSRVHESKGLNTLIEALARLPAEVILDVFGTGNPAYLSSLHRRVRELGLSSRVAFHGHVEGRAKAEAFSRADLFVLPTFSENFGIAVAEALAHGVPVVTTKAAPWPGLETERCGMWIAPDADSLVAAVGMLMNADLEDMGRRGYAWMKRDFSP
jgi:glycosyltransferase involved in cell wall biosynthesis